MNKNNIDKLIIKFLENRLNKDETLALKTLLKVKENRTYFKEYVELNYFLNAKNKFDYTKALNNFEKTIKKPLFNYKSFLKYAAILSLLISTGYFISNKSNEKAITKNAVEQIKPGYKKATLILGDGTNIDLESTKNTIIASTNATQIKNTDYILKYSNLKNTPETNTQETTVLEEAISYNTIQVPTGGMYQVELPDGTNVWINSESSLKYPIKFTGEKRIVKLTGEAYFEVTKNTKEFIVETNSANITVLGTKFNVSSYNNDTYFSSTLVEGKIKLTSVINTEKSIIISPGQRGKLENGSSIITVKNVDPNVFTSWKEGKFYFEKESLDQILTKIGRWYNIDVAFDDPLIKNQTFTGVALKNKPVDYLLKMISETANLKYNIIKNTINDRYELTISKN